MDERTAHVLLDYLTSTHWRTIDVLYARDLPERVARCVVCEHTAPCDSYRKHVAECQFGGGRLERYACPKCDTVFGPLKMLDLTAAQLAMEYRALYTYYSESNSTELEIRAFRSCRPRPGGLYLNWGCGAWAETIDTLRAEGYDVWGYEPVAVSENAHVVSSRDEISALFDGIFSNNVIEHFADPVSEFRRLHSHLKPGGLMVHASPCYELLYENTRFHLALYLGRSAETLAARTGFEVVDRERDGEYMQVVFRAI
jgi:SAM-dependent methyltransferase